MKQEEQIGQGTFRTAEDISKSNNIPLEFIEKMKNAGIIKPESTVEGEEYYSPKAIDFILRYWYRHPRNFYVPPRIIKLLENSEMTPKDRKILAGKSFSKTEISQELEIPIAIIDMMKGVGLITPNPAYKNGEMYTSETVNEINKYYQKNKQKMSLPSGCPAK